MAKTTTKAKKNGVKKKEEKKIINPKDQPVENEPDNDMDDMEEISEEERAEDENRKLMHYLTKPEELLNESDQFKEDIEVVTVCPVCRVEGVFVDNTCPNCGARKKSKTSADRYEIDEDVFTKNDDFYVNSDDE